MYTFATFCHFVRPVIEGSGLKFKLTGLSEYYTHAVLCRRWAVQGWGTPAWSNTVMANKLPHIRYAPGGLLPCSTPANICSS